MNPQLANDLATCHLRDLRQLGERHRRPTLTTANRRHRQSPLRRRSPLRRQSPLRRRSPLRRQIGFRLVEAGLHLMGTAAD
jgi:hypothetical protein